MTGTEIRKANRRLAFLAHGRSNTLGEFIDRAREIHTEIAAALEGVWCGTSGEVACELDNRHNLIVQWYNSRVEVAYIS